MRRIIGFLLLTISFWSFFAVPPHVAAADQVVGSGNPASCTQASLAAAIAAGGSITFNCGSAPTTITISSEIEIRNNVAIDGNNSITLRANGGRIFFHRSFGSQTSTLTLKNLTLTNGRVSGVEEAANGAAIRSVNNSIDGKSFVQTLNLDNVTVTDNDATLTGFDSGKGLNAYDFGGAIYSQGGVLNVVNSRFTNNDSNNAAGGALHILQSKLTVEQSVFSNNTAIGTVPQNSQGGTIYIDGVGGANGFARISRSTFSNSRSYNSGGAIYVNLYENSSSFSVDQSTFSDNAISGGSGALGGAISGGSSTFGANSGNASITISNSTFSNNSVKKTTTNNEDGSGGALAFAQRARITITNSTFVGNQAFGSSFNANGGALYVVNNSDPFQIVNSTFANNRAGWVGGAISNSQINGQPGGVVRNTLFVNNTADNGPNDWNIQQHCSSELDGSNNLQFPGRLTGGNFFNDVTCFKGKSAPNQTNLPDFRDPQLVALADNGGPTQTMAISASSPARDAGANCTATDQRGIARPQGNGCDLGAFELVAQLTINPRFVSVAAADRTITVGGAGFSASSKVLVNGQERPTEFVDSSTLRVTLSSADVAQVGSLQLSVSGSSLPAVSLDIYANATKILVPLARR
jgi:hypothetical protein